MLTIHNAAFRKLVKYKFFNFLLPYVAAFHCCVSFRFAIGCVILWLSEKFVACRALRIINSGVADPKLAKHVRTESKTGKTCSDRIQNWQNKFGPDPKMAKHVRTESKTGKTCSDRIQSWQNMFGRIELYIRFRSCIFVC